MTTLRTEADDIRTDVLSLYSDMLKAIIGRTGIPDEMLERAQEIDRRAAAVLEELPDALSTLRDTSITNGQDEVAAECDRLLDWVEELTGGSED